MTMSTQSKHPRRAMIRTAVAAVVALLPILPTLVEKLGVATIPWVAGIVAGAAAITRVLAMSEMEEWLHEYAPWLSAQPAPPEGERHG